MGSGGVGSSNGTAGCFGCVPYMGPDAGRPAFIKANYPAPPPDCPMNGCPQFPAPAAPACAGAPAINVVYPNDGVFVPPNMNVISVHWTPFGAFKEFEVAFTNKATDMRIVTTCAAQTMDNGQPPQPSGGCELVLTQQMWQTVANHQFDLDAGGLGARRQAQRVVAQEFVPTGKQQHRWQIR